MSSPRRHVRPAGGCHLSGRLRRAPALGAETKVPEFVDLGDGPGLLNRGRTRRACRRACGSHEGERPSASPCPAVVRPDSVRGTGHRRHPCRPVPGTFPAHGVLVRHARQRRGGGPAGGVRRSAGDHRRGRVQGAGVREGGPVGGRSPGGPGRAGRRRAARHPERGQIDRGEDRGVSVHREHPRAGGTAGQGPGGRPAADAGAHARPEEGDGALPRTRHRLGRGAVRGHRGRPPARPARFRRQDRGEPAARDRDPAQGGPARPARDGDGARRVRRGRPGGGPRLCTLRGRRVAAADEGDGGGRRRAGRVRPPGGPDGGLHRPAARRSGHRGRGRQDLDPHRHGPAGGPAGGAAGGLGRGPAVLHRVQGAQHPDPRDRRPRRAQNSTSAPAAASTGPPASWPGSMCASPRSTPTSTSRPRR